MLILLCCAYVIRLNSKTSSCAKRFSFQLNNLNFGTHIKKPDSMSHVKLIEFHKDTANCKSFVKDYNALAKTVPILLLFLSLI